MQEVVKGPTTSLGGDFVSKDCVSFGLSHKVIV